MALKNVYADVADRFAKAADAAVNVSVQEAVTFQAYHAFESIGGALAESRHLRYPTPHNSKINMFMATSKTRKYGRSVAVLGIVLSSLRNKVLYPEVNTANGIIMRPDDRITIAQAKKYLSQVKGIIKCVRAEI